MLPPSSNQTGVGSQRLTKRESFRAPIERAPADGSVAQIDRVRHRIIFEGAKSPLAELSATGGGSSSGLVDIDAELVVSRFNLTEPNGIANKFLELELPGGAVIGRCKVIITDKLLPTELDGLPSVSEVQPTREDLL